MSRRDAAIATSLALLAAMLGAAAVFGDRADAAWPGRPGSVVYVGVRQGEHRYSYETSGLYRLDPDVSGPPIQLTSDATDADPEISPDGRLVVFSRAVRSVSGKDVSGLFVIGIDGSGLRQLTLGGPGDGSDVEPAFYPSGRRIAFVRVGGSGDLEQRGDLYSIVVDGGGLRQVTASPARERSPAVSPTGRQIAFGCAPPADSLLPGPEHICSIRPDGSHRRDLTPRLGSGAPASSPDFSPSGRTIAFSLGHGTAADVFTMRANGSRLGALTNRARNGRRNFVGRRAGYALPAFSPGGGALAAVARPGSGPRLVRIRLRDPRHPRSLAGGRLASAPVWAPR